MKLRFMNFATLIMEMAFKLLKTTLAIQILGIEINFDGWLKHMFPVKD